MGRAHSTYEGKERCIQGLVGKTEGKTPVGRPRHRWDDSIKMDVQEVGCEGMARIDLAQDRER
jgi:hypothetical protein